MATSLITKLQTAMQANAALVAMLGVRSDGKGAIYDTQLVQGTAFPALVMQQVSKVRTYSTTELLINAQYRIQFTVYAPLQSSDAARAIIAAIEQFLTTFNAYNAGDTSPMQRNYVVGIRDGGISQTQPLTYTLSMDALIWHNETL